MKRDVALKHDVAATTPDGPEAEAGHGVRGQGSRGQGSRRAMYGLNVGVASLAAIALVVLVNFLAVWSFSRLPPGVRDYLRYDQSAQRWYSLSERSRATLGKLDEPYRIVTLLHDAAGAGAGLGAAEAERRARVREFISLYGRSPLVEVEHLNPLSPGDAVPGVYREVASRYEPTLRPLVERMHATLEALDATEAAHRESAEDLEAVVGGTGGEGDPELRRVGQVAAVLARTADQMDTATGTLRATLDAPLPPYADARLRLANYLAALAESTRSGAASLDASIARGGAPGDVLNAMERVRQRLLRENQAVTDALRDLQLVVTSEEYEAVRRPLTAGDAVVLLGPRRVRVLRYSELFAGAAGTEEEASPENLDADDTDEATQPDAVGAFIGEQRITGALASFSLARPPLVVFVHHYSDPRFENMFSYLESRLRLLDMEVRRVNLVGSRGPSGERLPPDPLPQPDAGQAAVWVVFPIFQTAASGEGAGGAGGAVRQALAELVQRRLDRGEGAVLFFDYDPAAEYGAKNPLTELASRHGIVTRLHELVLWEQTLPGGKTRPRTQFDFHTWPEGSAVTRGMGSTPATVYRATPLTLEEGASPLVVVRRPRMYLESDPQGGATSYKPEKAVESATVGAVGTVGEGSLRSIEEAGEVGGVFGSLFRRRCRDQGGAGGYGGGWARGRWRG